MEEQLEIVNERGDVLGVAPRSEIHGDPSLLHRVVHVLVFSSSGKLLLQKRSTTKDVAPGKWDTSVGGHVEHGESLREAVLREMDEELGINSHPDFLYTYIHSNDYEAELVYTYMCTHDGPFEFDTCEIDEVRFWGMDEIGRHMDSPLLSDNFKHEISTYLEKAASGEMPQGHL